VNAIPGPVQRRKWQTRDNAPARGRRPLAFSRTAPDMIKTADERRGVDQQG
jgi:hypothetical protein